MDTAQRLVAFIKEHGHTAWVNTDGTIGAIERFAFAADRVVRIEPRWQAVRDWLGY